jgi:hypothetical protein
MKFTLKESKKYAKSGKLDEWVIKFLEETDNRNFANHVKNKGYWVGPINIKLSKLKRCCGPEKEMKYKEPKKTWDKRVSSMVKDIKLGWDVPPLIVWFLNKELSIADGSHRVEALRKSGIKSYWTITWFDNPKEYAAYKR